MARTSIPPTVTPAALRDEDFPVDFGRYTLSGVLGEGGMARVFRAELQGPEGFRKPAALKVIHAAVAARGERLRQSLVREARMGGLLHHPNIVETYDFGVLDGLPFIAMELVRGVGLDEILRLMRPLPAALGLEIGAQICAGLSHAHDLEDEDDEPLGIVHRDLKPSNVLINRDGLVKVMDFGIAKATSFDAGITDTGMTKGTPAYMSPEQAGGEALDRRSDLFAVGTLIYEMIVGRRLFDGESITAVLMKVIQVEDLLADPDTLAPLDRAAPGLAAVVYSCLRRDPALRLADAGELEQELRELQRACAPAPPLKQVVKDVLAALGEEPAASFGLGGKKPTRTSSPSSSRPGRATPPEPSRGIGLVVPPRDAPAVPSASWARGRRNEGPTEAVGPTRMEMDRTPAHGMLPFLRPESAEEAPTDPKARSVPDEALPPEMRRIDTRLARPMLDAAPEPRVAATRPPDVAIPKDDEPLPNAEGRPPLDWWRIGAAASVVLFLVALLALVLADAGPTSEAPITLRGSHQSAPTPGVVPPAPTPEPTPPPAVAPESAPEEPAPEATPYVEPADAKRPRPGKTTTPRWPKQKTPTTTEEGPAVKPTRDPWVSGPAEATPSPPPPNAAIGASVSPRVIARGPEGVRVEFRVTLPAPPETTVILWLNPKRTGWIQETLRRAGDGAWQSSVILFPKDALGAQAYYIESRGAASGPAYNIGSRKKPIRVVIE